MARPTKKKVRHGDPTVAVAYLRVSTDDQKLGPDAQRDAIAAWAKGHGVTLVAEYLDEGVSGSYELADRPALMTALADLGARRAGVLIVAKWDRLAREVVNAGLIEREVARLGATIVSADGAGNGDNPTDRFMRQILSATAEFELATIRGRIRAALASKKARGGRVGECPYGQRPGADGRLVPDPREQEAIAVVRAQRALGASLRQIVEELRVRGYVARSGKPLQLTQVARLVGKLRVS